MHIIAGIAVLAVLVGFAFGEVPARVFVGAVLGVFASFVLLIVFIAAVDITRSEVRPHTVIKMGSSR